jgi:hypothetical protein
VNRKHSSPRAGECVTVHLTNPEAYQGFQVKSRTVAAKTPEDALIAPEDGGLVVKGSHIFTVHHSPYTMKFFEQIPFEEVQETVGRLPFALVAVGGYGRAELCPQSDLDLALLHRGRPEIAQIAEQIWYPIWDAGFKLGHAGGTVNELVTLGNGDLDSGTSYLSTRHLAGDEALSKDLATRAHASWQISPNGACPSLRRVSKNVTQPLTTLRSHSNRI